MSLTRKELEASMYSRVPTANRPRKDSFMDGSLLVTAAMARPAMQTNSQLQVRGTGKHNTGEAACAARMLLQAYLILDCNIVTPPPAQTS
jgi:hypothetical protein